MAQAKQFTKKGIEKLFKNLYPEGEINLGKSIWDWWYCTSENSKTINIKSSNLYGVAEELGLETKENIQKMKIAAGY